MSSALTQDAERIQIARYFCSNAIRVKQHTFYYAPCVPFVSGFRNYFTEMTTMLRRRVPTTFGYLHWRSRSQRDLAAKSCPVHNIVIWSRIFNKCHRNDHHIETTCRAQNLGRYIEGQGHSMTLQQNRVWPITLFEVGFRKYILQKWSPYWDDVSGATFGSLPWKSRLQHDLAAKSCPAHNFVIWGRILQLLLTNYLSVSNTYTGSITRFRPALVSFERTSVYIIFIRNPRKLISPKRFIQNYRSI